MLDSGCLKLPVSSGRSSVAQHNPHINAIFAYLFMQGLFVDKFHVFKFLSMRDKPQLHQLKVITSSHSSTVLPECFFFRKEKYHQGRENMLCQEQLQNLTNLANRLKILIPQSHLYFTNFRTEPTEIV